MTHGIRNPVRPGNPLRTRQMQTDCPRTVPASRGCTLGYHRRDGDRVRARVAAPEHVSSRNCRRPAEIVYQQTDGLTGATSAPEVSRG
jgi:hypothetical protein